MTYHAAVILAAGKSERFVKAGYSMPKPFLRVRHHGQIRPMVTHVVRSIPNWIDVFVAVPREYRDFAHRMIMGAGVLPIEDSRGQCDTLAQAIRQLPIYKTPQHISIIALDCDTLLYEEDIRYAVFTLQDPLNSTVVLVENDEGKDPNKSRIDRFPYPTQFVEKQRVSPWGIVSLRGFYTLATLRKVLEAMDPAESLSPMMNHYPGRCAAVMVERPWMDWGTPARLNHSGAHIEESRSL